MSEILYYLTIRPPAASRYDAVVQEVEALRQQFGGRSVTLNPNDRSPVPLPRALFGFHRLRWIRRQEVHIRLHHVFNPDPFAFPVLRALHRPVVYSLTGGVRKHRPNVAFFSGLAAITVADEQSLDRLRSWGLSNTTLVRPGIDTARFSVTPQPLHSQVHLMVGSAPWSRGQFRRKGFHGLLEAARREPRLHLTFLWRGVLLDQMMGMVRKMEVERQVEVLDGLVDVNQVLAGVHAAVSLTMDPGIIRPYPHSLMESLAAGKPVLVSRTIPMAAYVERTGCGVVLEQVDADSVIDAVAQLIEEYDSLQTAALQAGQRDFSQQATVAAYGKVYERVLASHD